MDNKLKRKLAKERSLVLKLTLKQIHEILDGCGYQIDNNIYNEDGEHIPAILKYYDRESDEYVVEIKCKQKLTDFEKSMQEKISAMPFIAAAYSSLYYSSIVVLKDYSFLEISITSDGDKSLEHNTFYAKYMYNLFGEYYRKKYNQNLKKEQKQSEQTR